MYLPTVPLELATPFGKRGDFEFNKMRTLSSFERGYARAGLGAHNNCLGAAISLTRSAAMEYAPRGVRINAVAPGRVVTEMMLASGIADMTQVAASLPLRRMGRPEEVAAAVSWLLSDEAAYIVGHILCADGGFLAG